MRSAKFDDVPSGLDEACSCGGVPLGGRGPAAGELLAQGGAVEALVILAHQMRAASAEVVGSVIGVAEALDRERRGGLGVQGRGDHVEILHTVEHLLKGELLGGRERAWLRQSLRPLVEGEA